MHKETEKSLVLRSRKDDHRLVPEALPITGPGPGEVRVRVEACGVCGADIGTARNHRSDTPVTPGHEIAGTVDVLGDGVTGWSPGERVAIGWFGGSCGHCDPCRRGDVVHCAKRKVPGLSYPGGWAERVTVPADALARIPEGMDLTDAAPMGCAGVTTFTALRRAHLDPGSRVAVFGIGGLGHLAVQFAAAMGHEVVAMARGSDRRNISLSLGARHYIDTSSIPARSPGQALAELGGVDLILCAASSTKAVNDLLGGLKAGGQFTMVGIDGGAVDVPAASMVMNGWTLTGHLTGGPADIEDAMRFAVLHRVRPVTEIMALNEAEAAVSRLEHGDVRFRIVLTTGGDR